MTFRCDSISIAYLQRELNPDHKVSPHFECYLTKVPPPSLVTKSLKSDTKPKPSDCQSLPVHESTSSQSAVCSSCKKTFEEHAVGIVIGGKFWCTSCVKCTVCQLSMACGSITTVGNDIVHKECIVHNHCGHSLFPNNFYRTADGKLNCSFCTGCQCGFPACEYTTESHVWKRNLFLKDRKSEVHRLILSEGKAIVPAHRPCGAKGCREWCDTSYELNNPFPVCNRVCDTCGKCEHFNGGVFAEYPCPFDEGVIEIDPYLIGHREHVKCEECGILAKCTAPTYDHWVVKDNRVTHAKCFRCEDPNCGEKKKCRIVIAKYGKENKYVHITCYRAWKKRNNQSGPARKK